MGSWSAGQNGLTFTADAELCGAQAAVAGVAEAQVSFVATFPGSPFFNETLAGQIAFLPLSDTEWPTIPSPLWTVRRATARRAATTASALALAAAAGARLPVSRATWAADRTSMAPMTRSRSLIRRPDFDFGTGDFTLALWVKPDGANAYKDLFHWSNAGSSGDDFSIRLNGSTHLMVDLKLDGASRSVIADAGRIEPGAWHHVALVRAGGMLTVYIDGGATAYGSMPDDLNRIDAGTSLWVGSNRLANVSPYYSPFRGWLNDVRIFDRGLEAHEVAGLVRGNGAVLDVVLRGNTAGQAAERRGEVAERRVGGGPRPGSCTRTTEAARRRPARSARRRWPWMAPMIMSPLPRISDWT